MYSRKHVQALLAGEINQFSIEKRYLHKSGATVWGNLTVSLVHQADGSPDYFVAMVEDISGKKQSEDVLRQLSLAVEQSPSSIVITDLDANIVYANATFSQVTGYALGEVLGQNPRILHSGKTPQATYKGMWAHLTRGERWEGEFINKRRDGSEYVELVRMSPVRDARGVVTNYLAIKDDITDKKIFNIRGAHRAPGALRPAHRPAQSCLVARPLPLCVESGAAQPRVAGRDVSRSRPFQDDQRHLGA